MSKMSSSVRKKARKEVENNLIQLESLKQLLGKKKFEKRIKKAARLLTNDLPKTIKIKGSDNSETEESVSESSVNTENQTIN